jgi:CheY-like chemotaxis protein
MTQEVQDDLVMVVEDDADVREAIVEALADSAYQPLPVANGKEAIDILRARPQKPCVILLDIMMPVMDGRQFRLEQRQDAELSRIPVIVLTAHANIDDVTRELGAQASVRKPLRLEALLQTIGQFCKPGTARN